MYTPKGPLHAALATVLCCCGFASSLHAQTIPDPMVDYDGDGDCDSVDLYYLSSSSSSTYICNESVHWLYDFNLNGACQYSGTDHTDLDMIATGTFGNYQFYWCVKDYDNNNATGEWPYQMDNSLAQYTTNGHTDYPTQVVDNVAIFDQSWFGFWPALWRNTGSPDNCSSKYTGGLHVLLEPTPDFSWDDDDCTWQQRIRARFEAQGLDPDADGVSGDWLACWEGYLDLHHDRIVDAVDELCGTSGDFAGYGVVDYEQMWFDWDYTKDVCGSGCVGVSEWQTKVAEINDGATVDWDFLNYMDGTQWEFTPYWTAPGYTWTNLANKNELYEKSWNYFMYQLVTETLQACRDASTASPKWGFYGYPARSTDLSNTYNTAAAAMNDNLFWLWDHDDDDAGAWDDGVDMLLPSIYAKWETLYDENSTCGGCNCELYEDSTKAYRTTVAGMVGILNDADYDGSALILPFVHREYHASTGCADTDIGDMETWQQLLIPKFYGADGVMIWDSIDRSEAGTSGTDAYRLEQLVNGGLWDDIITAQTLD